MATAVYGGAAVVAIDSSGLVDKACHSCASDHDILFHAATAGPNGSNHDTIDFHGDTAAENYNPRVVRRVKAKPLLTALRQFGEIVSGRIECSSRPCFVDGNVDATKPRVIHPHMGDKTASGIDHCNVVGDAQLDSFFFARGD